MVCSGWWYSHGHHRVIVAANFDRVSWRRGTMGKPSQNGSNRCSRVRALLLGLAIASACAHGVFGQSSLAGLLGHWTTLADQVPINPVHVALLHNGKVL